MSTRTKIKISDDTQLRSILDDEYERSSQVRLCKYALLLATHILTTIHYDDMDHPILKAGYAVNGQWQKGNARMHDVRQAGFRIHQLAKSSQDIDSNGTKSGRAGCCHRPYAGTRDGIFGLCR